MIAKHLYRLSPFLVDSSHTRRSLQTTIPMDGQNGLDVAAWTRRSLDKEETLIMAVQMNYIGYDSAIDFGVLGVRGRIKKVLFGDVRKGEDDIRFSMGRTSVAAVILESGSMERQPVDVWDTGGSLAVQAPLVLNIHHESAQRPL